MKKLLIFLFVVQCFGGCSNDPMTIPDVLPRSVTVEVQITPETAEQVTRTTDETAITDINFYLFGHINGHRIHIYSQSSSLRFECPPGEYDLYIAANLHTDLGDMTISELSTYTIAYKPAYANLPMSARETVTISGDVGNSVMLPAINVRRNLAKVAYNIQVDAKVSDIRLTSVQVMNTPGKATPFRETIEPSTSAEDYLNAPLVRIPPSNAGAFSGTHYLFENMQGHVPAIEYQWDKSAVDAPKYATYLLIRAMRNGKALAYSVYLGENNTDNFDVRRNSFHTLNITIRGDNEIDTRISSYTLSVWDDIEHSDSYNGFCVQNSQKSLHIDVQGANNPIQLYAKVNVNKGNAEALLFAGTSLGAGSKQTLLDSNTKNTFGLNYAPKLFDESSSTLSYTVTIYDDFGVSQAFTFEHRYANQVVVFVSTAGYINGKGTITASGALYSEQASGSKSNILSLCNINGCTLTATPDLGYKFAGWYSDPSFTKQLSTSTSFVYKPSVHNESLYAKFILTDDVPLDKKGTANCYIAPNSGVWYSFNASIMGNDRTTKNIVPKRLSGTDAKVIWEMGESSGAMVIDAVLYDNGRIHFKTGSMRGNALIGLFDNAGNCVWSWHIWSVMYMPESSLNTEIYGSGAVFMNRNLGAISTNYNDETTRGMYYQWGRKDPFPYPSVVINGYHTMRPTYCLSGYDFNLQSNRHGTKPQSYYTIEWATAHPTSFLAFAPNTTGSSAVYNLAWLAKLNYNLWGNMTNGSTTTTLNTKTIYDPCPPGWKVPAPEAWNMTYFKKASLTSYGWYMYYANHTSKTFFRYTGYLTDMGDSLAFVLTQETNQMVRLWSNAPWIGSSKDQVYYLYILDSGITTVANSGLQHAGHPVRCIKE